ncbi:MAG: hypothetical protein DCC55_19870 [Chloroflexi bacterium]|nr:MAG: hypothetical protein DCC55_19870 [Chloroflexota bacterium]
MNRRPFALLTLSFCLFLSFLIAWPQASYAACTTSVFINEFHYDNVSTDVDEFIEIAGPAGTDLTGWTLSLYNGQGGAPYGSPVALSGVLGDEGEGFGALAFFIAPLQNGSPDGIALVDDTGAVRQFLSYEGAFTATGGPALGLTSVDVGVTQSDTTPIGSSLQLMGASSCPENFGWAGPAPASPGSLNSGQMFTTIPSVIDVAPATGAYDVAIDAAIAITFSTPITVTGPAFIECTTSGGQTVSPTLVDSRTIQLPHAHFTGGETCAVTLPADSVADLDGAPDPLATEYRWQFEVGYPLASYARLFIAEEEANSRAMVDAQDDPWRAAAQEAEYCPNFMTAVLQEAKDVQCGDRTGDCILPTTLSSGLVISYTLRNMDGRPLGSADAWASGHGDGCNGGATLQDGAPRPNGIPGCYYNDAGNLRGSNNSANAVLFSFSEPVFAFGAWFGDLETKPFGANYYRDGSDGGTGAGGAQAFLRLFFEDGSMQEAPIEPVLAPAGPWLAANSPPSALPLTAGGDIAYCGGYDAATDATGCGNSTTRWVGFVSDEPGRRVTQMLVAVGDDDHSGAGPSDGPNVVCEGGEGDKCNGGTEYLSFIGPTVCVAPDLTIAKQAGPATVRAGDVITYTLTYSNHVPGIDTGPITVLDELPLDLQFLTTVNTDPPATLLNSTPQWQVENLPAGATGWITFTVRVEPGVAGMITNTARISTAGDIDSANNRATAQTFVAAPALALSVHLNGQDASPAPGPAVEWQQPLTWTYQITNTGNVSLTQLTLAANNLELTCLEGSLPAVLAADDAFTCTVPGVAGFGENASTTVITGVPAIGPDDPVTATAASYYVGEASGRIVVVVETEPEVTQPFTITSSFIDTFALVAAPGAGQTDTAEFSGLQIGQPYTLAVVSIAGWRLSTIGCTGAGESTVLIGDNSQYDDGDTGLTITPAPGETIICTFSHSGVLPTLTLVKSVVNDNGGAAVADDFSAMIDGVVVAWQTPVTLASGEHWVDESVLPGYTPSAWSGDCTADGYIVLDVGEQKVCHITNDDTSPRLTVQHVVINEYGGSASASDFPLFVNDQSIENGVTVPLNAGIFTVTVTGRSDYVTTMTGDCAQDGTVALQIGDVKHCTIVSNDRAPVLTVVRVIINDHGGDASAVDFPLYINGEPISEGEARPLMNGSHTVSTLERPGYFVTYSDACSGSGIVVLAAGEEKHCIVTLDDLPARLTVHKIVINDDGGTANVTDFPLFVNDQPVQNGIATELPAGRYVVSEVNQPGYAATFSGDCTADGTVTLTVGAMASCTITNDDIFTSLAGRVWHDLNRDGIQDQLEPGVSGVRVTLHEVAGEAVATALTDGHGNYAFAVLAPGDYYLTFAPPTEYGFTEPDAGDDDQDSDADPQSGQTGPVTLRKGEPFRVIDAGLVTTPQLQFHKEANRTMIWLSPGRTEVVTYTLTYSNLGPDSATGVEIIEQPPATTTFLPGASSAGWLCIDVETGETECRYTPGDLPAGASGTVLFAVRIGMSEQAGGAIENVAYLRADGIIAGEATAAVLLEASANVEVRTPTALDEAAEPGQFSHRIFLPWVAQ